jgi:hypothetical protein
MDLARAREASAAAAAPSTQKPIPTPEATAGEQELAGILPQLESRLKSLSNPALPLVSLTIETRFGRPKLAWCFATTYDVPLDVSAAEAFLNTELRPYGITVSDGGYMGSGVGTPSLGRTNLFLYTKTLQPEAATAPIGTPVPSRKWWRFWQ